MIESEALRYSDNLNLIAEDKASARACYIVAGFAVLYILAQLVRWVVS